MPNENPGDRGMGERIFLRAMWRYIRLVLHRAAKETWETIGINRQTAFSVLVFFVVYFLSWRRGGRDAVMTEFTSFWTLVLKPTLIAAAILFVLSLIKAAHSLHEDQEKKNADLEKQLAEATRATREDLKDARKREYKIERLKELVREGESLGWIKLDRENAMRYHSYGDKARAFLADYYDETYVQRFNDDGVSLLRKLLKDLLEQ